MNSLAHGPKYYSWLPNHQIWKHKGEEYRIYGGGGWEWVSQNRKRKLLDPITKDERAAKIRKFEKTFDLALKRKLSKKHKMALQEKKLKMSKSGEAQPSSTSQTRVGSTVSTAKSRGGPMVNANQIGVNTGQTQVATSVKTPLLANSTSAPAAKILNTATVAGQSLTTTVSSSGQIVSTSATTGHLATNTVVPSTNSITTTAACITTNVVTSHLSVSTGVSPTKGLTNTTSGGQSLVTTSSLPNQKITYETPGQTSCSTLPPSQTTLLSTAQNVVTSQIPSSQERVSTTMSTGQHTNTTVQTTLTPVNTVATSATLLTQQQATSTSVIPIATTTATGSGGSREAKIIPTSMVGDGRPSPVKTLPLTSTIAPPTMTPPIHPEASTASSNVPLVAPPVQSSIPTITSTVTSSTVAVCSTSTVMATNTNNSEATSSNASVSIRGQSCTPSKVSIQSTSTSNPLVTTCNATVEATTVLPMSSTTNTRMSPVTTAILPILLTTNTTMSPVTTTVLPMSSTTNTSMSSEPTTVLSTSSTTNTTMSSNVTLLNANVSTTYCTLPPVSSTLPAMIFDEPAETPPPIVVNVPSNTSMASSVAGLDTCVPDASVSSDESAGNNCGRLNEEPATNKLCTSDPSVDMLEKNNTDNTSSSQTLCAISDSDTKDKPLDSNTDKNINDIQSSHSTQPISLSSVAALPLNQSAAQCRGAEESMDVDTVDNNRPPVKSLGTTVDGCDKAMLEGKITSDIQVVVKDGREDEEQSSLNDNKDVTSGKSDATNENCATVENMQVDDPKDNDTNRDELTTSGHGGGSNAKPTINTEIQTGTSSQVQDKVKNIIPNDNKPTTASNTDEPTSVSSNAAIAKTPEQNTPTSTSTQVTQSTSSATQDTASQVSTTTSQVSASAPQSAVSTSKPPTSQVTTSQVTTSQVPGKSLNSSASQNVAAPSQVPTSASQSTTAALSSVSTVRIETTGGVGLNNLTPEKVLKFIADELMKESDAGKALLTGVAASISTSEGKVIIKPEPTATSTAGVKGEPIKPVSMMTTPGVQSSAPVRLILQTVPGHTVVPGGIPTSRIQVLKTGPQVVHTGVSQGKPLTPIAPAQRIVISNLPSGTVLGSQGQLLAKQGQVLGAQNISGTKVIRMTIPRAKGSTPVASTAKVVTPSKPSTPATTTSSKAPVTPKAPTPTVTLKPAMDNFPMRHPVIKDPKILINMNLKKWKRRSSRKSIFVVDKNVVRSLARKGGLKEVQGFHYNTKWNSLNYPQDFPRPSFMTAWRYRTQSIRTLAAAAIQTRILNASMKWDEMNIRPPRGSSNTLKTSSGKHL